MSLWHLKLIFFCASVTTFFSPVFAATAEQLFEQAQAKSIEKDGCSAEAIANLDQAIAKGLNRPGVLWLRGYCHQSLGQHQEAIIDFSKALVLYNKQQKKIGMSPERIFSSRGSSYVALKQDNKALDDFSRSLAINNALPAIHVNRGNVYLRLKQYQKAIDDYSAALRLRLVFENKGRVLSNRAKAYEALGKYDLAKIDRVQMKEMEREYDVDSKISSHKRQG